MKTNKINHIILDSYSYMLKKIAFELGQKRYDRLLHYNQEIYLGRVYRSNDLVIYYHDEVQDDGYVVVFYKNVRVFEYNESTKTCYTFENNGWIEAVKTLYKSAIDLEEEEEARERECKILDLKSLEDYYRYIIGCYYAKRDEYSILEDKLSKDGIRIETRERALEIKDNLTGKDKPFNYREFMVLDNDSFVSKFNGNPFNVFPNIEYYSYYFKSGDWMDVLKLAVHETKRDVSDDFGKGLKRQ